MTKWQQCVIVGCDCRRRTAEARDIVHGDEWICRGHWSMAMKKRRTFYNRIKKRVEQVWQEADIGDHRKLASVYRYLWYRLKREITEKAFGI